MRTGVWSPMTMGRSKTRIFCCGVSPSSGSSPPPMEGVEFPPAHSRRPETHTADFLSGRKRCWYAWRGPPKNGRLDDSPQSSASRRECLEPPEYRSAGIRWTKTLPTATHGRHREGPSRRRSRLGRTSPPRLNGGFSNANPTRQLVSESDEFSTTRSAVRGPTSEIVTIPPGTIDTVSIRPARPAAALAVDARG